MVEETKRGATTGPRRILVEGAAQRSGNGTRSITDVLMEPRRAVPPPKLRKRRVKRSEVTAPQGTIKKYFSNICIPKEWNDGGGGSGATKRKGDELLEDWTDVRMPKKSLKLMVEDYDNACMDTNSRTRCPITLGGKIREWDGADGKTIKNTRGEAGFKTVTEKEGGIGLLGLDETTPGNI